MTDIEESVKTTQKGDVQPLPPLNPIPPNMKGTASGLGSLFPRTSAASTLLPGDNPVYEDAPDVADTGLADVGLPAPNPPAPITVGVPMGRPQLARNQDQPPPQSQPRPPPPPNQIGNPQDSLSLMQLRRIVNEFPKSDMLTYAFEYEDTAAFEEEVNEWFSYNSAEYTRLIGAKETFQRRWRKVSEQPWIDSNSEERRGFMQKEVDKLLSQQLRRRCKALQSLLHVILGVWDETAGLTKEEKPRTSDKKVAPEEQSPKDTQANWDKMKASSQQLKHMQFGIEALVAVGGIKFLFRVMQNAFQRFWDDDYRETQLVDEDIPFIQDELDNLTTIFYVIIEGTRKSPEYHSVARAELLALKPGLLEYFVTITAKLRWDEANELPQTRIFLLFWKTILLTLGGTNEVDKVKWATDELANLKLDGAKKITASPLDYHIFRQEITSKYPAYIPPQPLFPLEPENNSILPPLPNRPSRTNGANGIITPAMNINSSGTSILHQPVHIATPAPSPPPSPPVGGKAGKKQNYQTNQNFPFMYPPLDSTSNTAGGKGLAGLQGSLVGRKWEGSEIPKSILEAGTLFAERMRMTRAMRQLWDERERFLKFERGWGVDENNDVEELELDTILSKKFQLKSTKRMKPKIDYGPSRTVESGIKSKLDLVENFYQESIPHFQSLVIVLLKAVLANVTALITQPTGGQQGGLPSYRSEPNLRAGGVGQPMNRQQDPANIPLPNTVEPTDLPIEEVEALRSREIIAKAVSGILLILLKWFKVSHILKFEYFTQLLLDSNYLPLVLKLFAHQDVDKIIDSNTNRDDASFFQFCNLNSNHAPAAEPEEPGEESDDDASPPPIKMTRKAPQTASDEEDQLPALAFQDGKTEGRGSPQELDDMEYMIKEASAEPITDYSWRNFFSSINFLRIMQKICKNKAHRNLLLVQYKSSNILKKALKIPQPELRLYTLKLFKNQVPYCGRKWRQTNMRVITAVYLHCRPELRDDWLAGSDVDADVEEALPLEQALRALTHWHNIKRYPDQIGADTKLLEEEHDFFVRELERMEWIEDSIEGDSVDGWENNMGNW